MLKGLGFSFEGFRVWALGFGGSCAHLPAFGTAALVNSTMNVPRSDSLDPKP